MTVSRVSNIFAVASPAALSRLLACTTIVLILLALLVTEVRSDSRKLGFQPVDGLYEPSGVVQLEDGRLLTVEDEPSRPFAVLTPENDGASFAVQSIRPRSFLDTVVGRIGDLEGVSTSADGFVYAITSHSRKSNGKRDQEREKLLRFKVDGERLYESSVRGDLRNSLTRAYPVLKEAAKERDVKNDRGLNIEGLSFGPQGRYLWIGLRAPLLKKKAVLVGLLNPHKALGDAEKFRFGDRPILLDLNGGGIRDIAYDPHLKGYLILSQREGTSKEKSFKLWFWNGKTTVAPQRVRVDGIKNLERAEGVTPVSIAGDDGILILSDDGDRAKNRSASYLLFDYADINMESKSP